MASEREVRTYGNFYQPTNAGLYGLGLMTTLVSMGIIALLALMVFFQRWVPALIVFVLGSVLVWLSVHRDDDGMTRIQTMMTRIGFARSRAKGETVYRSGPMGTTVTGQFDLPGLLGRAALMEGRDSYGRRFAIVHHQAVSHFTVVFGCWPEGSLVVDDEVVDGWVASWGAYIASLGMNPAIVGASATVETAPDTGERMRSQIRDSISDGASDLSRAVLEEVAAGAGSGSASVRGFVAITFSATMGGQKRSPEQMRVELAKEVPSMAAVLAVTGAGVVRPVDADQLCEVVRTAYDPAAAILIDEARAKGQPSGLTWGNVGPAGAEAKWNWYRHDSGASVTWEMAGPPTGIFQSQVLDNLVGPLAEVDRKRVTLLYRPVSADTAADVADRDVRASTAAMGAPGAAARKASSHVAAKSNAKDQAAGAGLTNFGVLITATVMDVARLDAARSAITFLGPTARLKIRVVTGSQDSAFAAALPLGVLVPAYMTMVENLDPTN